MKPGTVRTFLALLVCAVVFSACNRESSRNDYDGVIEMDQRLLSFELGGRILEVKVERGSLVEEGQLLAILDSALEQAQVPIVRAELAATEAQLQLLVSGPRESELREVADQLRAANAEVQQVAQDLQRQKPLVESGVLPQATLDDLRSKHEAAEARRDSVAQQLKTLKAGTRSETILSAMATRDAAAARLDALEERLTHYEIKAPAAGQIVDVMAKVGEVVNPGTPVLLFGESARPYVDLFIPVPELHNVQVGEQASIVVDGDDRRFPGTIEYISPSTEYTPRYLLSDDDRTALTTRVRIRIEDARMQLHAGVPCRVALGAVAGTAP